jgi:hypothetical protein
MSSKKVASISRAKPPKSSKDETGWIASYPYIFRDDGIHYISEKKDGEKILQLSNFKAEIVEETVFDDGQEQRLRYAVTGNRQGIDLPRISLAYEEFQRMDWPARHWGGRCNVWPGTSTRDRLRHAIQSESYRVQSVPRQTIYGHTGWREIDSRWVYLSASAVIGAAGAVEGVQTDLGPELANYALPVPSIDQAERRAAALASFEAGQVVGDHVGVPLTAMVYLAPLAEALGVDFSLWLEGPSRSQKSTFAALMLAHFGASIDRTKLTANFTDTANAIEAKLFALKDTLTVVDDYAPQPSKQAQGELDRTVSRIVRNVGNLAGRGRLHADCSLRREKAPRGACLMTGEQWPTGESIMARLFGVTISPGEVDLKKLTACQAKAAEGLLARAMADYVRELAADLPGRTATAKEAWTRYRAEGLKAGLSGRSPEQVAYLMVGYAAALRHWNQAGVLPEAEIERRRKVAWTVLVKLAEDHERRVSVAMPAEIFRDALVDLLASGEVHLLPVDGQGPGDDKSRQRFARYGWKGSELAGKHIGWIDPGKRDGAGEAYLLLTPTLQAVNDALRKSDSGINLRQDALMRQLKGKGYTAGGDIEKRGEKTIERPLKSVKIGGHRKRVLVFFGERLFGETEA